MDTNVEESESRLTECKDWYGEDDSDNPRNWSTPRKVITLLILCFIGFVTTLAASIYAPGHDQVTAEFGVSSTVGLLPLSFFNLGLAFGPCIASPLSETFGRKFVYLITLPLFDIFVIGTGFSKSIGALIVCRFFAGLFAAPGVSVASATISDFTLPTKRGVPLSFYYSIPYLGSAFGPFIGVFLVESKGWRWTAWTTLFFAAATHPPILFVKESYKTILLQRRAKQLGIEGPSGHHGPALQVMRTFVTTTIIRPLHMLTCEPTVAFICLYTAFQFALLYTFVVASPWVFFTVYGFSVGEQGLSFLGLIVGCCIAPGCLIAIDRLIYQPRVTKFKQHPDPLVRAKGIPPEEGLYGAMFGCFILPMGLFCFAWTSRRSIHWICPIIASGITILGSILVYVPCCYFMLDVYGAKYGASAAGASSLSRYVLSAAFSLFVIQMYEALGVDWATSLLAFLTILMAPIPWVFYYFGPRLRARSSYEHGT